MTRPGDRRTVVLMSVAIALVSAGLYLRTAAFDFIGFDDFSYVSANPRVASGLTPGAIAWAFTTIHTGNWHPLTWMSHMIDATLFGLSAGGHHLTSVALHAANAVLLFLFLVRATGAVQRSAFVALLFAVHPLNVESVAWIAERKNVLSTFFWLLTLLAYTAWARRRGLWRYTLVLVLFALGLMAKPMLVTLPAVLLLLDFWPLGRSRVGGRSLLLEKVPLAALATASCVVTFIAQRQKGLTGSLAQFPPGERLANAVVSYGAYLHKMVWPSNLRILYPHPVDSLPGWKVAAAGVLIAAATGAALLVRRHRPYIPVGWFWYLGTLVPVIGMFILIAWGVSELLPRTGRAPAAAGACALILALATATLAQVGHWRNDGAVARRAIEANGNSLPVATAMTATLARTGKSEEAVRILRELPDPAPAMTIVGQLVARDGMLEFALQVYQAAVSIDPGFAKLRNHYGVALARSGDLAHAREQFSAAVRLEPGYPEAQTNLDAVLAREAWNGIAGSGKTPPENAAESTKPPRRP
jgi:tetratricopeptide (TPR) repeat protein